MTTLFGGLGAVLVLYAAGGLWRGLSPMLRAVLAGVIPLAAYFILIVGRWPGLDVVAMHISVFLAAALVLLAMQIARWRARESSLWHPRLGIPAVLLLLLGLNSAQSLVRTRHDPPFHSHPLAVAMGGQNIRSGMMPGFWLLNLLAGGHGARLAQHGEAVGVGRGHAIALRGDDMVGHVDAALDRDNEVVLRVADLVRVTEEGRTRGCRERGQHFTIAAEAGEHLFHLRAVDHGC